MIATDLPRPLVADLGRFSADRPPVLLAGGLNLIRPLGMAGIPAIVATHDPHAAVLASRYCQGRCLLPPQEDFQGVARTLLAAGDQLLATLGRRVPLLYGNDYFLELVSELREELEQRFLILQNDAPLSRALMRKDRFERLAAERGILVPRTLSWEGATLHAEGAVLAKPKSKADWDSSALRREFFRSEGKAAVYPDARAAMDDPLVMRYRDQLTFQDYVPGDDRCIHSFHGYADEKGELLAWFVGRKIRTFPASTGASSYLELAHDEEVRAVGADVAALLPLKGPFKVDMKKHAGDGRCYVLEINARFNLWHYMGAVNGVNLPAVAYDYLVHGRRPAELGFRTSTRWLDFRLDRAAYRELASRGELGLGRWLASLFLARKVHTLFSWRDPLPTLVFWRNRIASRLGKGLGFFARWLSTAS